MINKILKFENWVHDLYGTMRFEFAEARNMLLNKHLNDIEELQKLIIEESQKLTAQINNDDKDPSRRKYEDLVVQLILLLDYVNYTPFIHAADSIIAVTKYSFDSYGLVVDQSRLHFQGLNENKIIVKEADREFMIDNFLPEFLAKIDKVTENGPSIMQNK